MEINKKCQYCGVQFIAKKTTTRCCSDNCAKRYYKQRKKEEKVAAFSFSAETTPLDIEKIQKKDYLTVKEVMLLLSISRTSIYRMLKDGRLTKLQGLKSVRIRKADFDLLFKSENNQSLMKKEYSLPPFGTDNYFTINQILEKFSVSAGSFYQLCKKHNIPKIPKGKNVFVPKELVEQIFDYEQKCKNSHQIN
jgi:excisionase family DNA binding protein